MARLTCWVQRGIFISFLVAFATWGTLGFMALSWALDDTPPFKLLSYTVTQAPPGGTMLVDANVKRDLERRCEVIYSRRFIDSRGVMRQIESDTTIGVGALEAMNDRTPNRLLFAVQVPIDAPLGKAIISTPLRYTCNPWHLLRPITFSMDIEAEVVP